MSENIVRDPCIRCTIKHLGQAKILLDEARLGYPHHVWYAMAHMAEAEAECVDALPADAGQIRAERIKVQDSLNSGEPGEVYLPDFPALMNAVARDGLLPEAPPADLPDADGLDKRTTGPLVLTDVRWVWWYLWYRKAWLWLTETANKIRPVGCV